MMTPVPGALGGRLLAGWRLDRSTYEATWDSGVGAHSAGGRWNSKGQYAVYASIDPGLAILEVAVHKGFETLDTVPHTLTAFEVTDPSQVRVVMPDEVPNPHWLRPCSPSAGQQAFGDSLMAQHAFILIPSAVTEYSWNLLFNPNRAAGLYRLQSQNRFSLDTRLNPPFA